MIFNGILCGVGAGALWGLVFLTPELVRDFPPLHLTLGRYLCYGLISAVLLAPRWRRLTAQLGRREWFTLAGLALVGNLLYYLLLSSAVQRAGIATSSLIIGLLPVTISLIGSRERNAVPLGKLALPLSLCSAGAVCIGLRAAHTPAGLGVLYAVGALIAWTWFAVHNARTLARLPQLSEHDWNLLTGLVTGLCSLALLPLADHSAHSPEAWLRLTGVAAAMALLCSIAGNALWNRMSRMLPLTLVGPMILFETLFALVYGFLWEHRGPTRLEAAAFVFISLGVLTCIRAHQRPRP
ncbi:multidrug DMT transporter permease [bacterium SCN 62-11]|nr:DMT family transporter [Candidatus Eremiobacteraeota bacterium]ODT56893.1 MAG: multidrug DMT transporter permease [bacterium SCN 62-11]